MDVFIGNGTRRWEPGERVWHLYALPDLTLPENTTFADLARHHHAILTTEELAPHVSAVPEKWLHATIQMITRDPATTQARTTELIERLENAVARINAFTTHAIPVAGQWGTELQLWPDAQFAALHHAATDPIRRVLGPDALHRPAPRPHITTAYCTAPIDSGIIASHFRRVRPPRADLTITRIALVDVLQDPELHQYRWDVLHEFTLRRA